MLRHQSTGTSTGHDHDLVQPETRDRLAHRRSDECGHADVIAAGKRTK
jgi:hypothetical protein